MFPEEDGSNNIETTVNLSHLDDQTTEMFTDIRRKYPDLYAQSKHDIGMFKGFEIHADPKLNCKQKQRSRFLPFFAIFAPMGSTFTVASRISDSFNFSQNLLYIFSESFIISLCMT